VFLRVGGGAWTPPTTRMFSAAGAPRRYMVEGDYSACVALLHAAQNKDNEQLVLQGWDKALEGRKLDKVPKALMGPPMEILGADPRSVLRLSIGIRLGSEEAYDTALRMLTDKIKDADGAALIAIFGQVGK